MSDDPAEKLRVVLCWHMHQPQYRDLVRGEYRLPWTYLHGIKDYVDMAAHLEAVPAARAVVNFVPVLLDQLTDYAQQIQGFLQHGAALRDPLLAALADPVLPHAADQRLPLMHACLRANRERMIHRFPAYRRLTELADMLGRQPEAIDYVKDQFLIDLLVWYHLAWLGETVRREDARVKALLAKEKSFSVHDRRELLAVVGELLAGLVPRWRALAARGQVELSVSPYAHPIVPLLLELHSAREAMPHAPLPTLDAYPGGEERVRWHMREALRSFEHHFGTKPQGCWPSEGSVSDATLRLLEEFGLRWTASGESVLRNSAGAQAPAGKGPMLYAPYRLAGGKPACFFRDDRLSDQIGFVYSDWHADDAVANLVHHLENIAEALKDRPRSVVSIILDGENAWEYYPENGYYFLSALYQRLADHPRLRLTTFSACLDEDVPTGELAHLVPGSWVYGTFSTWIGEADKNRGWEMLGEAKRTFDAVAPRLGAKQRAVAQRQLAVCEGSDWFWWFGGDNPAGTVSDFDQLYRMHLSHLYELLGQEPPEYLAHAFTRGGGTPVHGGVMRPGQPPA